MRHSVFRMAFEKGIFPALVGASEAAESPGMTR
jgi:hypothetical protein